ncbi:hypothetical protein MNBD_ALPHA02-1775 [hydrothermal vent metagenome]|uniref:DUF547 domain-containing protein n=1 Tax=hydrothermal vent metagenome TaxID=652676 RepID=A0A3B0SEV7_9ZZZZ
MKLKPVKFILISLCLSLAIPILPVHSEFLEENNPAISFSYNLNSKTTINYENWSSLLKATVVRARMSSRRYAKKPPSGIGSRINLANQNPTRLEASRVLYNYLTEDDIEYIHSLRLAMEALPQVIDFQTLNPNEQLAYWLNLYNITVYEQVATQYPVRKLKDLHNGTHNKPSMWDKKILKVNGVFLSLNDIQYNIIYKNWPDPIIMYGLYQGSIGGPNLRKKAYTGKNVYDQLEYNAEEFINSLRGLRFRGKDALVSKIYEWNSAFFPDFETDLRRHLRKYTNFKLTIRLDTSKRLKTTAYDWYIADTTNANFSPSNGAASTNPVAMLMQTGGRNLPHTDKAWDTSIINLRLRNRSAAFLVDFLKYNNENAKTKITIEEIEKDDLKKTK